MRNISYFYLKTVQNIQHNITNGGNLNFIHFVYLKKNKLF